MMEYFQNDMLSYYTSYSGNKIYKIAFQYAVDNEENKAALNFHLTRREEKDIMGSILSPMNQKSFQQLQDLLNKQSGSDSLKVE